jgi:hypothetical protein
MESSQTSQSMPGWPEFARTQELFLLDVEPLRLEDGQCANCQSDLSCRHDLNRAVEWVKIIKQKSPQSLPDIPTREEVQFVINSIRKLRFRIFLLVVYSLGLGHA